MKIDGAVALVTGGASGLGAATARRLTKAGATVVIVDRDADRGSSMAKELGGEFAETDVTDPEQVQAAVDLASGKGPLRIAVSCAGVGIANRTLNKDGSAHDLALFQKVISINLVGTFNVLRLSAAAIAQTEPLDGERGVIVNTASVAAFEGQIGQIAYSASKGGVHAMTVPAARDLARAGIRVNTVAPGIFDTPMLAMLPEPARESLAKSVVFPQRLGDPDFYAQLVEQIVVNPYINGETVRIDGAIRMGPK